MDFVVPYFALLITLVYIAGIVLIFSIMILTIQALRLAIQALKKYLQS